ncbi:hypothetical protein [Arthrobacter sp. Marseille-P9274]|uniref:hypothetical protein n=1 Tax=Arthrobacter sp. Marseille-P9274 TaxID=2866572 RepID=UPI0021C84270|nr:hypothetical protein [Arthrobacter sp. Marseille-P9274]
MSPSHPAILMAIRSGDFHATMRLIAADPAGVTAQCTGIAALYRSIGATPHGSRSPEGLWHGRLAGHYECVLAAHAVCIGAEQAAKLTAVPRPFASRELPRLFPAELPVFVETWAKLYQRSPRYWDRVSHYPAMFDWVKRGLIEPPTADGAVNLLLSQLPWVGNTVAYLRQAAGLMQITLPRLFDAEVRPSTGAAAVDSNLGPDDPRRIDRTVAALVTEGLWEPEMVEAGIARAWETRTSPFQRRWLTGLGELLQHGQQPEPGTAPAGGPP